MPEKRNPEMNSRLYACTGCTPRASSGAAVNAGRIIESE
jgi:hypothetical protein